MLVPLACELKQANSVWKIMAQLLLFNTMKLSNETQ